MTDLVRAHVVAHGRVQGVFYRDTVRRAALELGVAGHARNMADGTVDCAFEGPREAVEQAIEVAREGSPSALVERLDVEWLDPAGADGFTTG